ncbi:Dna-directed rna polymerase iii subunit rpc6 [Thalictrum thalictroides]|uniref:Dna-directed rna polymerase iii subunit rpc6 n=1 Tax=Thalictrum thalictroides TaxID=46969 RepID=A0A7J6WTI6_THATH|nr:Dna-directed rna polymerase iii subunit rpc6 [Thalictrum thalictroides]KAF5200721.1 Dna-directed rna polymerase iii subunit rpc6 [Thalictrum thalictroides]
MGSVSKNVSNKRKHSDAKSPVHNLSEPERKLYDLIRSMEDKGMWTLDMKRQTLLPETQFKKHIKSLQTKNLIKEIVHINNKRKKYFMATDFEPSVELTGGAWYVDGELDKPFINVLRELCKRIVYSQKVVSIESISKSIREKGCLNVECSIQQIDQIMQSLVLDNVLMEVTSTGMGEFEAFRVGTMCYRKAEAPKVWAMASIPCGVCPRINECTPDGIISPATCIYFTKWLDF